MQASFRTSPKNPRSPARGYDPAVPTLGLRDLLRDLPLQKIERRGTDAASRRRRRTTRPADVVRFWDPYHAAHRYHPGHTELGAGAPPFGRGANGPRRSSEGAGRSRGRGRGGQRQPPGMGPAGAAAGTAGGVAGAAGAAGVTKNEAAGEERTRLQRRSRHSGEAAAKAEGSTETRALGERRTTEEGQAAEQEPTAAATATTSAGGRDLR